MRGVAHRFPGKTYNHIFAALSLPPATALHRAHRNLYSEPFMSVIVVCECTNTFSLKDEYAERMVKCPSCGAAVRAGTGELTPASEADPIFGRDVFLLRQQALRVNERYDLTDEQGTPILFVERPAHFLRNLGALLAGVAAGLIWLFALIGLADAFGRGILSNIVAMLGLVGCIFIAGVVGMALGRKRHVGFY